jgi:hypothetical protein
MSALIQGSESTMSVHTLSLDMHTWLAKLGVPSAALALALLSSNIEHAGPELAQYGNMCGQTRSGPCVRPSLNGGFPFAYLFDAPGVSVEGKLSFGEDDFRPAPFVLDVAVYLVVTLVAAAAARSWSAGRRSAASDV